MKQLKLSFVASKYVLVLEQVGCNLSSIEYAIIKECNCSISDKVSNSSKKDLGILEKSFRQNKLICARIENARIHTSEQSIFEGHI